MYRSEKRWILTNEGQVVEAGEGVSGTLIVAAGSEIHENEARKYGLLPPADEMPKQKPMVAPIIVRGPEGTVSLDAGGVKVEETEKAPEQPPPAEPKVPQIFKPWQGEPQTVTAGGQPETGTKTEGSGESALKLNE